MSSLAILVGDESDQARIARWLVDGHDVQLGWPRSPAGWSRIAAVIADAPALSFIAPQVSRERQRRSPAPLPVLLLVEPANVGALDPTAWLTVDDAVVQPLDRLELQARVERLLRECDGFDPDGRAARPGRRDDGLIVRVQEAALPRLLPRVPGLTLGSFYRPGVDRARAGGDWYDALLLTDGRVLFSIGDVCGSGLDAAVATATVRHVFRGAAQINPDPAVMLEAAHRSLVAERPDHLVTAFVGVFDPITSLLTYASAGHPRPLLRAHDGSIVELEASGAPLGLPFAVERTAASTHMPKGSLLVLYTDGLTEASRDPIVGEAGVRRAIADAAVRAAPNVALAIHDAVIAGCSADDVAILTIAHVERTSDSEPLFYWSFDACDASAARTVRAQMAAELRRQSLSDAGIATAELVFSELVGNVVRYAAERVDVALDASGLLPVLHILDGGPGFRYLPGLPVDVLSDRGRGLFIVAQLTAEFHVTKRPQGGSHARAVLTRL